MALGFAPSGGGGLTFGTGQSGNLSFKSDGSSGLSFGGPSDSQYNLGEKISGFAKSTLESFPELFGITPSDATEAYRASNPVSGFASQALGTLAPYLVGGELLEAAPITSGLIKAAGELGSNPVTKEALKVGTQTAMLEAGRLGLAASPIPGEVFRGDPNARDQSLLNLAGGAAFNIAGGAALGGLGGAIGARLAAGPKIQELTGVGNDTPVLEQLRGVGEVLDAHAKSVAPIVDDLGNTLPPSGKPLLGDDTLGRLTREQQRLTQINLQDAIPDFAKTGEAINNGNYNIDQGRIYRDLNGETKKDKTGGFLDKLTNWQRESPDKITSAARPIVDANGGLRSADERAAVEAGLGMTFDQLAQNAQNARVITIKGGTGKQALNDGLASLLDRAPSEVLADTTPLPTSDASGLPDLSANLTGGDRLQAGDDFSTGVGKKLKSDSNVNKAKLIERRLTTGAFSYVGDGYYLASEKDGLQVMAKKAIGEKGTPAPGDQWVVFRTDKPQAFSSQAAASDAAIKKGAFLPERPLATSSVGEQTFDTLGAYLEAYGKDPLGKLQGKAGAVGSLVKDSLQTVGTYGTPTGPLAQRNPIFNLAFQAIKNIESHVSANVDALMRGERSLGSGSLVKNIVKAELPASEGLDAAARSLSQAERDEVQGVMMASVPYSKLSELHARGEVSDGAFNMLSAMQSISDGFDKRIGTLREATTGNEATTLTELWNTRQGHYGMTRSYNGAYKVRLLDEEGELAGLGSGDTPLEAKQAAQQVIEQESRQTGQVLTDGGLVDDSLDPDVYRKMISQVKKPGFLKSRGSLLGYEYGKGDLTGPKLSEILEQNIRARENFIRDIALWEKIKPLENELRRTSPQDAQALRSYMERLGARRNLEPGSHNEGAFARAQNQIMDKALSVVGFSGGDSASKIVRATQRTLSDFQFNFVNIMQPVQNLVGLVQTLLPEVAFVTNVSPEVLARHYVSVPVYDGAKGLKGSLGYLSDLKVFGQAMGHIFSGNPEPELSELTREMVRRGVLAPRFAEEQFGSSGAIFKNWRSAFGDVKSFVKLMEAANQFMVGKSEEINRLATVSSAYQMGKLLNLGPEQMIHFTQEMIGKVNYGYGVADRAKVFTTPAGSLIGTFKNWQFHFMASMLKYSTNGRDALPSLMWQTAATGLFGGAVGMPFVMPVADGVSKFLTKRKAIENAYGAASAFGVPDKLVDGALYGLPGALGVSLSSSVSEPGSDPVRDASMIFSFVAADRMKALSQGVSDGIANYVTNGTSPFENDTVRNELMRAVAPRTIYRTMQVAQDSALRSLSTGNPILNNIGLGDRVLYASGFSPVALEKTYYAYNEIKDDEAAQKATVKNLGESLSHALESGDGVAANRVYVRGMALGIDGSRILRSAQSRAKGDTETQLEHAVKPKDRTGWEFAFPTEGGDDNATGASATPGLTFQP